jgi:hypothetical protein
MLKTSQLVQPVRSDGLSLVSPLVNTRKQLSNPVFQYRIRTPSTLSVRIVTSAVYFVSVDTRYDAPGVQSSTCCVLAVAQRAQRCSYSMASSYSSLINASKRGFRCSIDANMVHNIMLK